VSINLRIEQLLLRGRPGDTPEVLDQTPELSDEVIAQAQALAVAFGPRPTGVRCPEALVAAPLGRRHVAIARVHDDDRDDALRFHMLILERDLYRELNDPFALAERYPVPTGSLETLEWPPQPLPRRSVAATQRILKDGDSPWLLGGGQALVDGGQLLIVREEPAPEPVRAVWSLLPNRTRAEKSLATWAFAPAFDLVVVPQEALTGQERHLTEEQARDYPEGRYEKHLQIAVEGGDQNELDRLFARRTAGEAFVLAVLILVGSLLVLGLSRWLGR
jgi:hypothetical protein